MTCYSVLCVFLGWVDGNHGEGGRVYNVYKLLIKLSMMYNYCNCFNNLCRFFSDPALAKQGYPIENFIVALLLAG